MLARLTGAFTRAAEGVSSLAFAAMFVLFLAGIFARYVLAKPIAWSDELIMVIFLWMVFLTEAFVIAEREQVTFDGLYDLVGERSRRAIQATGALAVGIMFMVALPTVFDYVTFPLARAHQRAAMAARRRLFLLRDLLGVRDRPRAFKLARLAGPNWRDEVAPVRADERATSG